MIIVVTAFYCKTHLFQSMKYIHFMEVTWRFNYCRDITDNDVSRKSLSIALSEYISASMLLCLCVVALFKY